MTREEFIKHKSNGTYPYPSTERNTRISQTNPAFAQSVRDMIYNPLPITPRPMSYFQGPLIKDMYAFDKLYPDKFDAFRDIVEVSSKTKKDLDALQKKYKDSLKDPKNEPTKNEPPKNEPAN